MSKNKRSNGKTLRNYTYVKRLDNYMHLGIMFLACSSFLISSGEL